MNAEIATAAQPDALREAVTANEFLTALFGSLQNGCINIWTDDRVSHWFCWNEIEQASAFVDSVNGSKNVWFQTGVMGRPKQQGPPTLPMQQEQLCAQG